jgi:glycosyltransferase involved in cell wall biosynthesis
MRVLHILNELKPSGAEMMYLAAAGLWQAKGMQCDILTTGQSTGVLAPKLAAAGYRIFHLPFKRSMVHVVAVYWFLRKGGYDVVHVNPEQSAFWYALAAYAAGSRRIFRTVHNVFPFEGWLKVRRKVQRRLTRALGVRTISISPSVEKAERKHFGNPTELIPNWYDDREYRPATPSQRETARAGFSIAPNTLVLSSIAGCWSYKNHPAILKALTMLPSELNIVYLHAGMEDADCSERKLASQLGLGSRARFLGIVPETLPVLHASDIYLMPSLYEGFGCAAIEAMGAGIPAILASVPGLQDFAGVCPDIRWVQPTPESLAAAILDLARMPSEERISLGCRLSATVSAEFGLANGAAAYERLYRVVTS